MSWKGLVLLLISGCYVSSCSSCTKQHDPRPEREKFKEESATANRELPTLTKDGTIPVKEEKVAAESAGAGGPGEQAYATYCVACHGPAGDSNVPTAAVMNPKPRDFTDASWQSSVDDARIAKVIKEGGAAVGLSPTMAPWGAILSEEQVAGLVEKVRSFKK